ncbi:outer membrane beta-barrel protein [Halocola ammonii]
MNERNQTVIINLKTVTLACLFFVSFSTLGQGNGIVGGFSYSNQVEVGTAASTDLRMRFIPGFHLGFTTSLQYSDHLFFDGALLFEQKGVVRNEIKKLSSTSLTIEDRVRLYYLNVPVRAQYRFSVSEKSELLLGAGIYGSVGTLGRGKYRSEVKGETREVMYKVDWWDFDIRRNDYYWLLDFGLATQVGVVFDNWKVEINYDRGLMDISSLQSGDYKLYNQSFRLSVSYKFGP